MATRQLGSIDQFRTEEDNKQMAKGFISVPGIKSRRYYNPSTGQEISVRQYQRLQKGEDAARITKISPEQIQAYNTLRTQQRDVTRLQSFYKTVEAGNQGKSVSASLKAGGLSQKSFETISSQRDKFAGYGSENGKYTSIFSTYEAQWVIPAFTPQGAGVVEIRSFDQASSHRLGQYYHAVGEAIIGNTDELRNFGNNVVVDIHGNVVILPTNVNQIKIYRNSLSSEDLDMFDNHVYQLVKGSSIRA